MAELELPTALRRAEGYSHAIVSYVDADGYPASVAAAFVTDPEHATLSLGPLAPEARPPAGAEVCVTFSHIRPQSGVGYDERRYINVWGPAEPTGDGLQVRATRATGWDEADVPFFEYAERSVPVAHEYLDEVGGKPRLSRWWTFFLATRLPFLTATIVPIALGGAVAGANHAFALGWWLLALVAGCAVHLGLNIANDLFDDASGADAANVTPTPFSGGSRVLQYGLVSRRGMVAACVGFYAIAVGLGVFLAAERGWWLLAIGAVGVALSLAYTAPPFRLVHRGLGEPVTALGFGPVMTLGAYFVCAQEWSWEALYISLPVALLIALVLYVNQIPDRAGDEAVGKRTLIVRWPESRVITAYEIMVGAAFVLIALGPPLGITPWWTLLGLLTAPMALKVVRGLRSSYGNPYALMPVMQTNIALHLFTGLLLVLGYIIDALVG
ncbi:MAG TPA: prenyltransferase [Acidimicrobiia bacterium]|jgi:1,4-dihydroxy-2-naphthoate octaprenyltransferase